MESWGDIRLKKIVSGEDFWALIDALLYDQSGFFHNRTSIVEAYKREELYGLRVEETDEMYNSLERSELFLEGTYYLLPCLCVMNRDEVEILWVRSVARCLGFGKTFVKLLKITTVKRVLPGSEGFWEKCGVIQE